MPIWTSNRLFVMNLRASLCAASTLLLACSGCSGAKPPEDTVGDASVDSGSQPDSNVSQSRTLGLNDVSILFPLDASSLDSLIAPTAAGLGGALLPFTTFQQIDEDQPLTNVISGHQPTYDALRVVAARYDSCFRGSWGGVPCQPQIRLTMQPLIEDEDDHVIEAADGAVHLMYNLSDSQNDAVLTGIRSLAVLSPENETDALSISPALAGQGVTGAYGTALRALILQHCGPTTLARLTFTTRTLSRQGQWHFGGFNTQTFEATTGLQGLITIFGIGAERQTVTNGALGGPIQFTVAPEFETAAGRVGTDDTQLSALDAGGEQAAALAQWFHQQANGGAPPFAADSTDCASCHLAPHIRRAAEAHFGAQDFDYAYAPSFISGQADTHFDNMRAFAYFEREPVITPRVARETAAVVAALAVASP